ncbi:MAG: AAA family ATPase [Desulfobacterales bacterium]
MARDNEPLPDPKDLEKEIADFLAKKFGGQVKVLSPLVMTAEVPAAPPRESPRPEPIRFDLKPEELIAYLDEYIVKQDRAKATLATKVCTHFNRIRCLQENPERFESTAGGIKNNVLLIGPTGVGKTYMVKLIAAKLGVPFVKGDATKFSETGYVGGDVEDLVRDLVREAGDDIERARYGIIYIDEIDKIASARNHLGADVSRTGVQRALLKPMEETEVELRVPHDPVSMMQEIERFRKTGKREKAVVNTRHILFIMSGAFTDLAPIIQRRLAKQEIGFAARLTEHRNAAALLEQVKAEDLVEYGFESEFVGRLPVKAVFEPLQEEDLFQILCNPNNPIVLGKKLDFAAYGIAVKFDPEFLRGVAARAHAENTGARGLVSAIEKALLPFERRLPTSAVKRFPVTREVLEDPEGLLNRLLAAPAAPEFRSAFERLAEIEREAIRRHLEANGRRLVEKSGLALTPARIEAAATVYGRDVVDLFRAVRRVKAVIDEIKEVEFLFYRTHDLSIVLEEDAIDLLLEEVLGGGIPARDLFARLGRQFEHGLRLVREKTGQSRFFLNRHALLDPEGYIRELLALPAMNREAS